jgi:hypothetical protein
LLDRLVAAEDNFGTLSAHRPTTIFRLGFALWKSGKLEEAESVVRGERPASGTQLHASLQGMLGQILSARGNFKEAEPLLIASHAEFKIRPIVPFSVSAQIHDGIAKTLVEHYTATNQPTKAAEWKKSIESGRTAAPTPAATKKQRTSKAGLPITN